MVVPSGNGNLYFVRFVFGASRARRIRIETASVPTNGINVASASEVSSVARAYPLVTIMGDSFVEAAGADFSANGEAALAARLLGLRGAEAQVGAARLTFANPTAAPIVRAAADLAVGFSRAIVGR